MTVDFMSNPTEVLLDWLKTQEMDQDQDFAWGRLAMGMEILTQIKILQSIPLTDRSAELEAAFQAFLVDQGLMDLSEKWYGRLNAWRAPKFVETHGADRPTDGASVSVSSVVNPEGSLSRVRKLHSSLPEHHGHSKGDVANDGSGELLS